MYEVSGLFIGLVSVEAVGLRGRKRKNWSYRESSSALTIKEFFVQVICIGFVRMCVGNIDI